MTAAPSNDHRQRPPPLGEGGESSSRERDTTSPLLARPHHLTVSPSHRLISPLLPCIALLTASATVAASPRSLILQGNDSYRTQKYDDAVRDYTQAQELEPSLIEATYNRAAAEYQRGNLDEAERLFREVDAAPGAGALAAKARHNLGRLMVDRINRQPPQSPGDAADGLRSAAGWFRGALDLEPADPDAARNLELTRQMIQRFEEQRQAQQRLQKQMQELAQKLEKNEKQQRSAADQSQSMAEQQPQSEERSQEQQEAQQQQQTSQNTQSLQEQLEQAAAQAQQQNLSSEAMQKAQEALKQARDEQQKSEEDLKKDRPEQARAHQQAAADQIRQAAESLAQQSQEKGQDQKSQEQAKNEEGKEAEDREQAESDQAKQEQEAQEQQSQQAQASDDQNGADQPTDQALRRILEKEKRDRERRAALQRAAMMGKNRPVEKDW